MTVEEARTYIGYFVKYVMPGSKYAVMSDGREIYFDGMSDEDAVMIAEELIQWEQEALRRTPPN